MTNTVNMPELAARHGKQADLRISAYRLTLEDLNALLQVQNAVALLSKLTHDIIRDTTITMDETAAVASFANTHLEQWLDTVHDAPIDEIMLASKNKAAHV